MNAERTGNCVVCSDHGPACVLVTCDITLSLMESTSYKSCSCTMYQDSFQISFSNTNALYLRSWYRRFKHLGMV